MNTGDFFFKDVYVKFNVYHYMLQYKHFGDDCNLPQLKPAEIPTHITSAHLVALKTPPNSPSLQHSLFSFYYPVLYTYCLLFYVSDSWRNILLTHKFSVLEKEKADSDIHLLSNW